MGIVGALLSMKRTSPDSKMETEVDCEIEIEGRLY